MTDLQLGSLIVGGVIVATVYAFNWWQEYRYRKQASKAFARNESDALLDVPKNMVRSGEAARMEPSLERAEPMADRFEPQFAEPAFEEDDLPVQPAPAAYAEPRVAPPAPAPAPAPVTILPEVPVQPAATVGDDHDALTSSLLDPALDFVAEIHAIEPIAALELPVFRGSKRVQVMGLLQDRRWEACVPGSRSRYKELKVGLQLADRQGALSSEQLNAFCMSVQQFADEHEAVVTFPQRSAKLNAAANLDEFCAGVDVLIGLNVMAASRPFPMERVRLLAENAGLVRSPEGAFHYRSDSGKTLFTLSNHDHSPLGNTSNGLTLLFDVPRVAGGVSVFDYFAEFAQHLSVALSGELVDDNGKPLTEASLDNIRKQLGVLYAKMDDRGIAPGSVAALRLFA
ncbi:cell division protein ZipA C-terminal FtsZ-binding domain-containing protein [Iodobacter sp. LRB]|uniref:cell division protein ZipA C-terminal FtsZ-binding domain-containing protein n=1 Tax=unclassified Iodobacter TaxID=235634 RepID=UPI000C0EFF6F|nr:cell division protein ZipA C-terminal FtsZ-binding domain-containing protein [Iodobacter sp. BJB302]PHV01312.1 cell division protein FtsZ [Iodobacter sp. BJB302]